MEDFFSQLDYDDIETEKQYQDNIKEDVKLTINKHDKEYQCICIYSDIMSYLEKNALTDLYSNISIDKIKEIMSVLQRGIVNYTKND